MGDIIGISTQHEDNPAKAKKACARADAALCALFNEEDRKLLSKLVLAARSVHRAHLQSPASGEPHNWGPMALIISTGDVANSVGGRTRRQPWHVDVSYGHAISLVSLLPRQRTTQYVIPVARPSLSDTMLQVGIPEAAIEEAIAYARLPTQEQLARMLPAVLPVIQQGKNFAASAEDFSAPWGHQTVMEHLVVHRGNDSRADTPRIMLFLTSSESGSGFGSYDPVAQFIRYQFPLLMWRLEAALDCLYRDRVDMPAPGDTFGLGDPLSAFLNKFVEEANAADAREGREDVCVRRDFHPEPAMLEAKAKELAPVLRAYLEVGAGMLKPLDLAVLKHNKHFPPTWARHYFEE
jgi:hypothetical protein